MRFAYIDSQGNEVAIPSVDGLALRIELGAISEDTDLYDAQAGRWGPAHTHEIFHTLSRHAEDDGFVPPPMAPPPPAFEAPAAEAPEVEAPPVVAPMTEEPEPVAEPEPEIMASAAPDTAPDEEAPLFDLVDGLGFEDPEVSEPKAVEAETPEAGGEDPFGSGGLDLTLADAAEDDAFDFGDFSGGLELDDDEEDEDDAGTMDFAALLEPADPIDIESPMDFATGGDVGGGLELETPMSEFTPDAPPAWMEQDGPGSGDDDGSIAFEAPEAPAASSPAAAPPGKDADDDLPKARREPRSRPSPPKRRRKAPVGAILGVVGVVVVGGGGFFAWSAISGGEGASDDQRVALRAVVIPDIPAELLPQMRDLAESALADMVTDLTGRSEALEIPPEPRSEWLGGNYLSNASQFGDIEEFWLGIERFVDEVRSSDTDLFNAKYQDQLSGAGLDAETSALMAERADSGFAAARDGRFEVYSLMDDLVNASLDLHLFLMDNEADIQWAPASAGFSADPVLEAVPATKALEEDMLNRITEITRSLADLGALGRVTRERLFAVLFDRIRSAGIQ
ncbi:MAG: hypothetical protein ACKVG4_05375 [Longimicrobiales bacterium]